MIPHETLGSAFLIVSTSLSLTNDGVSLLKISESVNTLDSHQAVAYKWLFEFCCDFLKPSQKDTE